MWVLAIDADKEFSDKLPAAFTDDYPYYDTCGRGVYMQVTEYGSTGWSVILAYASILYLLLGTFSLCLLASLYFPIFGCCALCGHCCGQCAHFALIITTGVLRFSDSGEWCAEQDTEIMAGKPTWSDHGKTIKNLFISQCVLYCFYNCFLLFSM